MKLIENSKKTLSIILLLSLILITSACSAEGTNSTSAESDSSEKAESESVDSDSKSESESSDITEIDNSSAKLTIMTQEYIDANIAEILMISYDGDVNPEIEAFNNAISASVQSTYDNFMESYNSTDDYSWIEILSYPFTSDDYLQFVTISCIYPTYGTDGDLYSYNFDLKNNKFLSVDDALSDLSLDGDSVTDSVIELLESEQNDNLTPIAANVEGFLITKGPTGDITQLLLKVTFESIDGDFCDNFFAYTPELNEIFQLNPSVPFDPTELDQMDPPLYYETTPMPPYGQAYSLTQAF